MGAVLVAAVQAAIAWAFRAVFLKAIIYGVFILIGQEVVQYVLPKISTFGQVNSALSALNPNFWYALDFVQFDTGFPLIVEAMLARFVIRRIPFFN